MLKELLPYLGYDVSKIPKDAETFFIFNNAPKSWNAFLLIAIFTGLIILIYKLNRKEHEVCPLPIKKFLGVLRSITFILIFLIFLDPALGISIKKILDPQILILLDDSSSMNIQDKYISAESQSKVKPYLEKAETSARLNLLKLATKQYSIDQGLTSKGNTHIYSFDKNFQDEVIGKSVGQAVQQLKADKPNTAITDSVKNVIHLHNGKKIAGIILISDGQSNTGAPLSELSQILQTEKIPLFAVGLGNTEKAKNIRITDLWLPDRVFKDDPFSIQVKVQGSQIKDEKIELQLIEIALNEQGEPISIQPNIIQRRTITFSEDEQERTIVFENKSEKEGKYTYKVKVEPLPIEAIVNDNEKEAQTEILSKSARVLLVGGTATWDFRMLQTLLTRDKTINVSCWLQSMDIDMLQEGKTQIQKLPDNEKELFEYDVVILLDPNPSEFDEKWILMLQKFVEEKKGGLMYIAGPNYTGKMLSGISTQKIKELLPVIFTEVQRDHNDFMKVTFEVPWQFHLTPEGQSHYIGKLNSDNNVNKEIWKSLAGIYWSYPATEAKAGAKVLLEHSDPKLLYKEKNRPLLVTGIFGSGRTVYMGFNGVWRWRKNSEKYFDKFWIQSVRYLVEGKLEKDSGKSSLYTNKEKYISGETINISAKLFDEFGQPFLGQKMDGKIFKGSVVVGNFSIRPEINRKSFYEGEIKADLSGDLNLVFENAALPNLKLERKYKVELPIIEYENSEMNYLELKGICDKTNGKFYYLSDIGSLSKDFPNLKETVVVNIPPDSIWDSGRFFLLILLLLSIEWTIRKKYKLL